MLHVSAGASAEKQALKCERRRSRKDALHSALDVFGVLAPKVPGVHCSMQPGLPSIILIAIVLIVQQRLPVHHGVSEVCSSYQHTLP